MKQKKQIRKYMASDFIASSVAWLLFNVFRYYQTSANIAFSDLKSFLADPWVIEEQILIPFFWIFVFYLSGYYNQPFRKSRLKEFSVTMASTITGCVIIFFVVILDNAITNIHEYYYQLMFMFLFEFMFVYLLRWTITQHATRLIHNRKFGFNTVIIGSGVNAQKITKELNEMKQSLGYNIIGYVSTELDKKGCTRKYYLGGIRELDQIVKSLQIEEFIVALDSKNAHSTMPIINQLFRFNLPIKVQANEFDILTGKIKMRAIYDTPMIDITSCHTNECDKNIKYVSGILIAFLTLILMLPAFLILAVCIKLDSKGPVFYKQQRVGYRGKEFYMYKFRSMFVNAEMNGPALSSENDDRITKFGKFMRKYRLDELPQFWNVLIGDMSIVGPRPERKYYIEQIVSKAPYYYLLQQVNPGITSWGMVKYGYACNVEQMVDRSKYDIIYLENMTLLVDLKIIIYTIKTVITGKGI